MLVALLILLIAPIVWSITFFEFKRYIKIRRSGRRVSWFQNLIVNILIAMSLCLFFGFGLLLILAPGNIEFSGVAVICIFLAAIFLLGTILSVSYSLFLKKQIKEKHVEKHEKEYWPGEPCDEKVRERRRIYHQNYRRSGRRR